MKKLWILILPLFVLTSCKVKTKAPVKKVVKTTKPIKVKGCTGLTRRMYSFCQARAHRMKSGNSKGNFSNLFNIAFPILG